MRFTLVALICFSFIGCASTAKLYPGNAEAQSIGILKATYKNWGTGQGAIFITLPSGEILEGEYTTVDTSTYSFGNIYSSVYGAGGSAFGSGSVMSTSVAGSNPGMASLFGNRGTTMDCEYIVNNWTGNGAGACKASNGAIFKLHF